MIHRPLPLSRTLGLAALAFLATLPTLRADDPLPITHIVASLTDGNAPIGGLAEGKNGFFFGTTYQGGDSNKGTIYRFGPAHRIVTLHSFNGADGAYPKGDLLADAAGNLYGTTTSGGSNAGTIFKITAAGTFTSLFSFDPTDQNGYNAYGNGPTAGLIAGGDGFLYGTTLGGGPYGRGVVYKIRPTGEGFAVIHAFDFKDGNGPFGRLLLGSDDFLYGTTDSGGTNASNAGTIFKTTRGGGYTQLKAFSDFDDDGPNGKSLYGGLVEAADGNFYGAAAHGGAHGEGVIFQIARGSGAYADIYDFTDGADGAAPQSGLTAGGDGYLYGATEQEVYGVTTAGRLGVVHVFTGGTGDGSQPYGDLLAGSDGNIYGATVGGGSAGHGVVYEIGLPPVITSPATATATEGRTFTYQIEASHGPTSYAASNLPAGLTLDTKTGLISGAPTTAGVPHLTLKATNIFGSAQASLTLTINVPAPEITSDDTATANVGTAFSYQITATNKPTSFGVGGLRPGLSVDKTTGLISGTPTGSGTFTLELRAANAGGTGSLNLVLTIKPSKPVITSPGTATAKVGQPFTYQIKATGSPTQYGVGGLFAGITVNKDTGLISGTPQSAGTRTLTLQATNAGGTGTRTLTLTVAPK